MTSTQQGAASRGGRGAVMGIINVTPDSFFSSSRALGEAAVERGRQMVAQGAVMIDVGGESTRPGAEPVDPAEELRRVIPVIEALGELDIDVSIDTRHESVARAGVDAGATVINDISASLGHVAADLGVGWVAMHMQGEPRTMQLAPHYDDVVNEVLDALVSVADLARARGAARVWIDPGIGFGKTPRHNLDLIASIDVFVETDYPVLLAVSRKGFIGRSHARADGVESVPPEDRLIGSLSIASWGFLRGVDIVRAHDVAETVAVADMIHYLHPQVA